MVEVRVKKRLPKFNLNVSFKSEGLVTVLFAPSGSGKSLTLNCVAGVVKPDSGHIEVNGKVFYSSEEGINLKPQHRRVGFLFQDFALFPHLNVWANVTYGCRRRELANELLKLLQIEHLKEKLPSQLSGGQKQRVALARALAAEPELLLLDEPFSALHAGLKEELHREILRIIREFSLPTLLVTHDIDEAFELGDQVVVMDGGKTLAQGEPREIYLSPGSKRVAEILGHRCFIEATVCEVNGNQTVVKTAGGKRIKCRKGPFKRGEKVLVSVLPFSVALNPAQETNRLELKVKEVKLRRGTTQVTALFEGREVELHLPPSLLPNKLLEPGRVATFYLSPQLLPVLKEEP
ncbi:ABC transporter related protein [Thermovibrio ammonificans HB-1]|uniref:ABC transporter related protein n=1 Tax=Thermovibrio ammonificans (strain DSM 15698 / JCM 12110 / HB-1) TaxID=648996 RepID=E8T6H0_THEA1|nr:ABC transporter ATP-binding protein [Thermovibrio ammonificans]ADU96754.1 ABC transporter related protein [Thermovibrio ammonificans HB-1]